MLIQPSAVLVKYQPSCVFMNQTVHLLIATNMANVSMVNASVVVTGKVLGARSCSVELGTVAVMESVLKVTYCKLLLIPFIKLGFMYHIMYNAYYDSKVIMYDPVKTYCFLHKIEADKFYIVIISVVVQDINIHIVQWVFIRINRFLVNVSSVKSLKGRVVHFGKIIQKFT